MVPLPIGERNASGGRGPRTDGSVGVRAALALESMDSSPAATPETADRVQEEAQHQERRGAGQVSTPAAGDQGTPKHRRARKVVTRHRQAILRGDAS